jgi:hypothetical protein
MGFAPMAWLFSVFTTSLQAIDPLYVLASRNAEASSRSIARSRSGYRAKSEVNRARADS